MKSIRQHLDIYRKGNGFFAVMFVFVSTFSVIFGIGAFKFIKYDLVINNDGPRLKVVTTKNTVGEVLSENGITVSEYDYINYGFDTNLRDEKVAEINIKKAVSITVEHDGVKDNFLTYMTKVDDFLKSSSLNLIKQDRLYGSDLDSQITDGLKLKIVRIKEKEITEKKEIPFREEHRKNSKMIKGDSRIIREGENGLIENKFKYVLKDGEKISKHKINEKVIKNPISKIIEFGTLLIYKTSRGDVLRYSKIMQMRATAYTSSYADTNKYPDHPEFGITYTGVKAEKGIIAVDPDVIPLGTRLYVEVEGDVPDYGYAVAGDIGGAIKGDLVDLYFEEESIVNNWGVKNVNVYILE